MRYCVCDAAFAVSLRRRRRIDVHLGLFPFFHDFSSFGVGRRIHLARATNVGFRQMMQFWNPLIMFYRVCDAAFAVSLRRRRRIDAHLDVFYFLTKVCLSLFFTTP